MKKDRLKNGTPWSLRDRAGLVFPERCPFCDAPLPFGPRSRSPLPPPGRPDVWIHPACFRKLVFVSDPSCMRCGRHMDDALSEYCPDCRKRQFRFERNLPLLAYNETARFSVTQFKYHGRQEYAKAYARLWMSRRGEELLSLKPDCLLPVPIHRSRLRRRGYNQAALFAYELEKLSGIPCRGDLIIRAKHTGAQKELGPLERLANMENAFRLLKKPEGIHCAVLVDDIYTTGSTAEACARLLSAAGIGRILVLTLCIAAE